MSGANQGSSCSLGPACVRDFLVCRGQGGGLEGPDGRGRGERGGRE